MAFFLLKMRLKLTRLWRCSLVYDLGASRILVDEMCICMPALRAMNYGMEIKIGGINNIWKLCEMMGGFLYVTLVFGRIPSVVYVVHVYVIPLLVVIVLNDTISRSYITCQ